MEDGTTYLNENIIMTLKISSEYIAHPSPSIIDNTKTVILADDGAATGVTLIAATRWMDRK